MHATPEKHHHPPAQVQLWWRKTFGEDVDEGRPRPFNERFDIPLEDDEVHRRFIHRMSMLLLNKLPKDLQAANVDLDRFTQNLTYALGESEMPDPRTYIGYDFHRCLWVLEVMYQVVRDEDVRELWSAAIRKVISDSEVDLGIEWHPPFFDRTGARLLDDHLVNEPLRWLSEPKYGSVRRPFEKGLSHYLEAANKPERLGDVVTDMYEAIEALAKIVTGRPSKDLSANVEMFISRVKASNHYKTLLKDYIAYANEYRHAEDEGRPRPRLSEPEVESFIYLTGLFIRLLMRTT